MTTAELYNIYREHPHVQTDTRKLKKDDFFFALSGPRFNGNQFALTALQQGAAFAVVDEDVEPGNKRIIKVDNVLASLQDLARHHREQFAIPFIAITGSNGKTTTKELVSVVLSSHFITYTTQGNLNNHIGIPLTLLNIGRDAEMAVIEMGANHQKEIEGYCKYTEPTHGVITNCGKAHLEGFGGEEGVKKGKGELFDYLRDHQGTVFIYNDYDYLQTMSQRIRQIVTYGTYEGNVTGKAVSDGEFLKIQLMIGDQPMFIQTRLVGDYNLPNVLCAVAIGMHFEVPIEKIISAIEQYQPDNSRSQMIVKGNNHIILDAYNANPTSMRAAIDNLARVKAEKKVLIIGGMMELGDESIQEHKNIINTIESHNWAAVALVGGDFANISHSYSYFTNTEEAGEWAKQQDFRNAYILLKGSRSIGMEKVLDSL